MFERRPITIPTISEEDVARTLLVFWDQGLKDDVMNVLYEFASELTGKSIDTLNEWV